jgi:hypothetical protein
MVLVLHGECNDGKCGVGIANVDYGVERAD